MCSVIILRRPGHVWPVILGANRDEMADRPWKPPARHWPDRPEVVAGLDVLAGGSWFGINDFGVLACILNRHGTLGPAPDKRSRGELVLEALEHADAADAARALSAVEPSSYRPFNLLIADSRDAFCVANREEQGAVTMEKVPEGVSMLTAHDLNDRQASPRVARYLDRFRAAPAPDPAHDDWDVWAMLLGSRDFAAEAGPGGAMTVVSDTGFGTTSSTLVALPAPGEGRPILRFAAGRPDRTPYEPIDAWPSDGGNDSADA
ncbi:MAG: NRDE family protein [Thalassobaculaceae bacterium]|nr:NRDE family protein [Thalassobaculaceae bacterium]